MKWGGKEVESSLHRATGAIIRCNPGKILTKSEVQYIRVSGNIALMLPILFAAGIGGRMIYSAGDLGVQIDGSCQPEIMGFGPVAFVTSFGFVMQAVAT